MNTSRPPRPDRRLQRRSGRGANSQPTVATLKTLAHARKLAGGRSNPVVAALNTLAHADNLAGGQIIPVVYKLNTSACAVKLAKRCTVCKHLQIIAVDRNLRELFAKDIRATLLPAKQKATIRR